MCSAWSPTRTWPARLVAAGARLELDTGERLPGSVGAVDRRTTAQTRSPRYLHVWIGICFRKSLLASINCWTVHQKLEQHLNLGYSWWFKYDNTLFNSLHSKNCILNGIILLPLSRSETLCLYYKVLTFMTLQSNQSCTTSPKIPQTQIFCEYFKSLATHVFLHLRQLIFDNTILAATKLF